MDMASAKHDEGDGHDHGEVVTADNERRIRFVLGDACSPRHTGG